jgi:hypothetical protein
MEQGSANDEEARLDELFRAWRAACPVPDTSANFMPGLWAGIHARGVSTDWFGRAARALTITALAASLILGILTSSTNPPSAFFDATFVEALRADRASSLEPLHLDRISELEP